VKVEMRNVVYHFADNIAVHIRSMRGELAPADGHDLPIFDDRNSFTLQLASAEMAISTSSLANVLNSHVLTAHDAPLKDIEITTEQDRIKVKGKLHNKGDISFEAQGTLSVTPDGQIRVHADKVKALHLPVKGLMDLFGVEIADLIKTNKVKGIRAEKDELLLDPAQILPPPHIEGKLTAVRIQGNNIVEVFGEKATAQAAYHGNYMAYKGNRLRFGKLTMDHTDMILIDMDERDPFDFYLDHYGDQLSAGYTKITEAFGLWVFMRDYDKLKRGKSK